MKLLPICFFGLVSRVKHFLEGRQGDMNFLVTSNYCDKKAVFISLIKKGVLDLYTIVQ